MNTIVDQISEFIRLQGDKLELNEMVPLVEIEEIFKYEGYEMEELDDNINGWQIDFWYSFEHVGKARYTVSGSLWYGNFKIYKNEKNTAEKGNKEAQASLEPES